MKDLAATNDELMRLLAFALGTLEAIYQNPRENTKAWMERVRYLLDMQMDADPPRPAPFDMKGVIGQ